MVYHIELSPCKFLISGFVRFGVVWLKEVRLLDHVRSADLVVFHIQLSILAVSSNFEVTRSEKEKTLCTAEVESHSTCSPFEVVMQGIQACSDLKYYAIKAISHRLNDRIH